MSGTVLMIVLSAAMLHAAWNFLVKRTEDKFAGMSAVVIGHTVFASIVVFASPSPALESLPYLFAGAMLHVLLAIALTLLGTVLLRLKSC